MKKGVFFGASVTAQTKGAGYCDVLRKLLASECDINQRGYGACHFDDAGFFYISEVLTGDLDFLVLEWNTTGLNKFDPRKFNYVLDEVLIRQVPFGFMIFPRTDRNTAKDRECERQVIDLCREKSIPLLDLRGKINTEECLRDVVHTNAIGAQKYGELISVWIRDNFLSGGAKEISIPDRKIDLDSLRIIRPIRQESFKDRRIKKRITIIGEFGSSSIVDIAASVTIGPQSPVIEFNLVGAAHSQLQLSLFDAWCDYERVMTVGLWPKGGTPIVGGKFALDIDLMSFRPDYSVCRKKDFQYDGDMYIDIHSLHTSGIDVKFIGGA